MTTFDGANLQHQISITPVRLRRPLFCFAPACLDAYHRLPEVLMGENHGIHWCQFATL